MYCRDAERHRRRRRLLAAAHEVGVRARPRTSPRRGGRGTSLRSSRCRRGRSPRARCGSRSSSLRCPSSRTAPARGGSAGTAPRRTAPSSSVGAAKCVPVRAARSIASATFGWAWPTTIAAEAAVGVDVLVAVDVPDLRALPLAQVDRVRVAGLERRADAERHRRSAPARTARATPACASRSRPCSRVGDLRARVCSVRHRSLVRSSSVLDHHVLELGVVLDRVDRHVLAVARLLEAAVRASRTRSGCGR